MDITREDIGRIVKDVLDRMDIDNDAKDTPSGPRKFSGGIFSNIDEAVQRAGLAFSEFQNVTLEKRKLIIENMRKASIENAELLAQEAHRETALGRVPDKIAKNLLAANKTPGIEDLKTYAFSGDSGLTIIERAPLGVIGTITPSTNPTSTVINNAISMVAAGNAVVFNPHPSAKNVSNKTMQILNDAIIKSGGPSNLLTSISDPTIDSAQLLMRHPGVKIIVVTGGPAVVKAAMASGKKVIAAGPGNPPVVVDETADIKKAACDIVTGASFDNGIVCILEKEAFVVEKVIDELLRYMQNSGAYLLGKSQIERLVPKIFKDYKSDHPVINRDFAGKDASFIASLIDLDVPASTKLLIAEVEKDHPLVISEQLMPVFPIVRVKDVAEGINLAIRSEHGYGHTAVMHSKNIENLHNMARRVNTSIFVKNAPSLAGLGVRGEGCTSFTIASPTGEGLTTASTFTRQRRCTLADYFRIT